LGGKNKHYTRGNSKQWYSQGLESTGKLSVDQNTSQENIAQLPNATKHEIFA
jgi:hypothetical protein